MASVSRPSTTAGRLSSATRPGSIELTVTDLDRSIGFYREAIGLRVHRRDGATATLGGGREELLVLVEEPGARRAGRHAGLYHFALLHPSRPELAAALQRLVATGTPLQGASDHGVSEALYLSDPDGNGIELYADRPREVWPAAAPGDQVGLFTEPLDVEDLLAAATGSEPRAEVDAELTLGHVHLHVGDLEEAVRFWCDTIGFEVMAQMPSAAFVSAAGYHHHLGLNTWRGEGVPPAPPATVGMRHWTLTLGGYAGLLAAGARLDAAAAEHSEQDEGVLVGDPAGNAVLLKP